MKKLFVFLVCTLFFSSVALAQDAPELPTLDDLEPGVWNQIVPGEDSICMYDTEYSFFVRPAEVPSDKLMIYFQGGGACWDGFSCGAIGQFASVYEVNDDHMNAVTEGMFDFANEANPVSDYNVVFAPYCTGDVHTGDSVVTFDVPSEALGVDFDEITVRFNGYNNSMAVLNWTFENFAAPEEVFVTGCSAGGYGATVNAPFVMQHYNDVRVVHLADAATGVTPQAWEGYTTWNTLGNLPEFVPDLAAATIDTYNNNLTTIAAAMIFPDNTFAQYNTFLDSVQISFYGLLTGRMVDESNFISIATEWSTALVGNLTEIETTVDNFSSYTAGGLLHCINERPEFYTYTVEDVTVNDWVADLLQHATDDYTCDLAGGECFVDPAGE